MMFNLFVASCTLIGFGLATPCTNDMTLPNDGLRYLHNEVNGSYEMFEDTFLTTGWYRSCGDQMLDFDPNGILKCGTLFPIWLNGSLPDSTGTPVNLTACLRTVWESCKSQIPVSIAKCDDNCYSYYLQPTSENSGYCFGEGVPGETPSFVPERPQVKSSLQRIDLPELNTFVTETLFVCDFVESSDEDLLYIVHWYMDGSLHYNTPLANNSEDRTLHITEDIFVAEKFKMGMELSCSVTAFAVAKGPASIRSEQSEKMFVGIRVLTRDVSFSSSGSVDIIVQPTVQIGCQGLTNCKLGLRTYVPTNVRGECQPMGFESRCGVYIESANYNSNYTMTVIAIENGQVSNRAEEHYEIYLTTSDTHNNKIWGDYQLEPISVTIMHGSGAAPTQTCRVNNDPHFCTFDDRKYDDHSNRQYDIGEAGILYRNTVYNTEVQVLYGQCRLEGIRCLCGVAAKAGQDIYVKQVCSDVTMEYTFCSDSDRSLTVKINGRNIEIHFSYGTYVKIDEASIYDSTFLTAEIYSSTNDKNKTRGLCGTFDGNQENEFHYRNGTPFSSDYHSKHPNKYDANNQPVEFLQEWSAQPAENLFNPSLDTSLLQPYITNVCVCEETGGDTGQGNLDDTIPCTPNGATSCKQGKVLTAEHCSLISTSRRRRSEQSHNPIPRVDIKNRFKAIERIKRQTDDIITWTETQAIEICTASFEASDVYHACSQVPSVSSENSVSVCIADIQTRFHLDAELASAMFQKFLDKRQEAAVYIITNGTDWIGLALLKYAAECREEVTFRNLTIVKQRAAGETMYDQIDNVTCPNECSGRGRCVKGECICDEDAGLSDCSIDLTLSPELSGLYNGGLCDRNTDNCTNIYIFGGAFVDSINLICRVIEVTMDEHGVRTTGRTHYVSPVLVTYIELILDFGNLRQRRSTTNPDYSFVSGYSISVTNNGQTYSDSADMFIFDSECQLAENTNGTLSIYLTDGYCFIENSCIVNGDTKTDDLCRYCNNTVAPTAWSTNSSRTGCMELDSSEEDGSGDDAERKNTATITLSAIGGVLLVAIVVFGIVFILKSYWSSDMQVISTANIHDLALLRSKSELSNDQTSMPSTSELGNDPAPMPSTSDVGNDQAPMWSTSELGNDPALMSSSSDLGNNSALTASSIELGTEPALIPSSSELDNKIRRFDVRSLKPEVRS